MQAFAAHCGIEGAFLHVDYHRRIHLTAAFARVKMNLAGMYMDQRNRHSLYHCDGCAARVTPRWKGVVWR